MSFSRARLFMLVALLVLFLAVAAFYALRPSEESPTNADALVGQNETPILTEEVAYVPGANGYFARPAAEGVYPGVVMIHENRGLRPEIKQMADELAREGYLVLAADLFEGAVVEAQEEARALTAAFDREKGIENLQAAAAYLRGQGAEKIASLGWCFGGGQSLQLALSGEPLDATVIYYGPLVMDAAALAPISWPVLGVFGDQDQVVSVESVEAFRAALDAQGVSNEIHLYEGVGHAFANPSGANYAPEATADAWEKTVAFLRANL